METELVQSKHQHIDFSSNKFCVKKKEVSSINILQ